MKERTTERGGFSAAEILLHLKDESRRRYPSTARLDATKQESGQSESGNR